MRPKLHFTAPRNWINDPNGLIYFNNEYHVFYQHFPYECRWGTMHWGHATTKDFIHYNHHGYALYPSVDFDRNGCFSGSAIHYNNQMYIYYTSIKYANINPNDIHVQFTDDDLIATQSLITSNDGYHFDNLSKQKVIDVMDNPSIGSLPHTRDPKVWITSRNTIAMCLGTKVPYEDRYAGKVLFYESLDGLNFQLKNSYSDPSIGDMWECPGVCKVDNQWFLIMSPEHTLQPPYPASNAYYMAIDFDEETFEIKSHGKPTLLDDGLDLYAPQTFSSKDHKTWMLSWLRMRLPIENESWVGMFTYPRELHAKNNQLTFKVINEIDDLFVEEVDLVDGSAPFKATFTFNKDSNIQVGQSNIYYKDGLIYIDRERASIAHDKVCNLNHNRIPHDQYKVTMYFDHHVVELYLNEGESVITQVLYDEIMDIEFNVENLHIYMMK